MAVMIYDFLKEIEETEVRDVSLFAEPVKYDPVETDLVDAKTDRVVGDTYERLAFKRVMRNRDERIYASKFFSFRKFWLLSTKLQLVLRHYCLLLYK